MFDGKWLITAPADYVHFFHLELYGLPILFEHTLELLNFLLNYNSKIRWYELVIGSYPSFELTNCKVTVEQAIIRPGSQVVTEREEFLNC